MNMTQQIEMICLEDLVPKDHIYRRFADLWKFENIKKYLKEVENDNNYKGYGVLRLFKCLLLQFMEDLSDRELERFLQENNALNGSVVSRLLKKRQILLFSAEFAIELEQKSFRRFLPIYVINSKLKVI